MPFTGQIGDTFFGQGPYSKKPHLYLVVSDPIGDPPEVVIVFVTTYAAFKDRTTVLEKFDGQHGYIDHKSVISYEDAQLVSIESIVSAIDTGEYVYHPDTFPKAELERIVNGLLGSPKTNRELKRYLIHHYHSEH